MESILHTIRQTPLITHKVELPSKNQVFNGVIVKYLINRDLSTDDASFSNVHAQADTSSCKTANKSKIQLKSQP